MNIKLFRATLSEWMNDYIDRCEEIAGREFDVWEIIKIMDYSIGFLCDSEMDEYITQALEFLGMYD